MKRFFILGVTASGKARLAFDLAQQLNGEILSVDSMKVYRRMDIGTAKASAEARSQIPYHLLDVVEPSEAFSVGRFCELAHLAVQAIESRGKTVIAVGGTALYLKTLLFGLFDGPGADEDIRQQLLDWAATDGLAPLYSKLQSIDPDAADRIDATDARRIIRALEVYELTGKPISSFQTQFAAQTPSHNWTLIGLRREKTEESGRINARVKKMVDLGLVDEVRALHNETPPLSKQAAAAIGYAEIIAHFQGKWDLDQAIEKIKINTRRLAKHQRTWFKTFKNIQWVTPTPEDTSAELIQQILENA